MKRQKPSHQTKGSEQLPTETETSGNPYTGNTPEIILQDWWNNPTPNTTPTGTHQHNPVIIHWWDTTSNPEWADHTEQPTPAPTITIGWITHQTPTHTTITPFTNPHNWCNTTTIPNGCIQHTQTLHPQ